MSEPYNPMTVRIIDKHAGKMPPQEIAAALGWTLGRLERVAAEQRIDLRIREQPIDDKPPLSANGAPYSPRIAPDQIRSSHYSVNLRAADRKVIEAIARQRFVLPGRLIRMVVEGAIARGKVDELVSAAAFYPRGNGKE